MITATEPPREVLPIEARASGVWKLALGFGLAGVGALLIAYLIRR